MSFAFKVRYITEHTAYKWFSSVNFKLIHACINVSFIIENAIVRLYALQYLTGISVNDFKFIAGERGDTSPCSDQSHFTSNQKS